MLSVLGVAFFITRPETLSLIYPISLDSSLDVSDPRLVPMGLEVTRDTQDAPSSSAALPRNLNQQPAQPWAAGHELEQGIQHLARNGHAPQENAASRNSVEAQMSRLRQAVQGRGDISPEQALKILKSLSIQLEDAKRKAGPQNPE